MPLGFSKKVQKKHKQTAVTLLGQQSSSTHKLSRRLGPREVCSFQEHANWAEEDRRRCTEESAEKRNFLEDVTRTSLSIPRLLTLAYLHPSLGTSKIDGT